MTIYQKSFKRKFIEKVDLKLAMLRNKIPTFLCKLLGGHDFYPPAIIHTRNLLHEPGKHVSQYCKCCGYRTYEEYNEELHKNLPNNYNQLNH